MSIASQMAVSVKSEQIDFDNALLKASILGDLVHSRFAEPKKTFFKLPDKSRLCFDLEKKVAYET